MLRFVDFDRLKRWLPRMASAEDLWCQLFSEPDSGSDLAALGTRAERDGPTWRISGQKTWSTWGQHADLGFLLARTGTAESRHRGITAFVIDMHAPGVEARPLRAMTGNAEFAEIFLDGVCVESHAVVGEVDRGWDVTMDVLGNERGSFAVHRAAFIQRTFNLLLEQAASASLSPVQRGAISRAFIPPPDCSTSGSARSWPGWLRASSRARRRHSPRDY